MRQHMLARQELARARRAVFEALPAEARGPVEAAFDAIESALKESAPPPPIEPGQWVVKEIDTFSEEEIPRTPRGKWVCPLCSSATQSYTNRESLANHLRNPHGVCPEPGCGRVIPAGGLAVHRARHEALRAGS